MQRLEPDDKSVVINFTCKVPQTIFTVVAKQAKGGDRPSRHDKSRSGP